MAIRCRLRYDRRYFWGDLEDILWSCDGAYVAETGKRIPHARIQFQRLHVVVDGFLRVTVSAVQLP